MQNFVHSMVYIKPNRELKQLYLFVIIRSLAISLISVFVPLYLYRELGYSITSIAMFYIVYSLTFGLFVLIAAKIISRIGVKHTILLSSPLYIAYFIMLYFLKTKPELFYATATMVGLAASFYWLAFHIEFAWFSDRKHRGGELSVWYSLAIGVSLAGPFIGGMILTLYNFSMLYLIASIVYIFSVVPLFVSKDYKTSYSFSMRYIMDKEHIKDGMSFLALGIKDISLFVFWPIFVYLILRDYMSIGLLFSTSTAASIAVVFVYGFISDRYNRRGVLRVGAMADAVVWFVKGFVSTVLQVFSIEILGAATHHSMNVPFNAMVYDKTRKHAEYLIFREMFISLGRIIVLLTVIATGSIASSIILTALSSFFYFLF